MYLTTAVLLIIPNALFPDMVRIGHLIEMTSSMLMFGIIAGNILWEENSNRRISHELGISAAAFGIFALNNMPKN